MTRIHPAGAELPMARHRARWAPPRHKDMKIFSFEQSLAALLAFGTTTIGVTTAGIGDPTLLCLVNIFKF